MTKQTEDALKMAYDWLNEYAPPGVVQACKEALEQPAQEPMYFALTKDHTWLSITEKQYNNLKPEYKMKCYTHPAPSWQGLSDDDKKKLHKEHHLYIPTIEKIEAMLKEKNHG